MPAKIIPYGECYIFGVPELLPELPPGFELLPDPKDFLRARDFNGDRYLVRNDGYLKRLEPCPPLAVVETPPWTVRLSGQGGDCELLFQGEPQSSIRGPKGRDVLIQLAALLNRKGISPADWRQACDDASRDR